MKKIYKIMVFVMMLALAIGSVALAPLTVFAAGSALVGATIVLTKMPTKGTVNTEIEIPKDTTSGSTVSVEVTDPFGKAVATTEEATSFKFTAKLVGDYKVTYTAQKVGNSTTKKVFTIHVTGSTATMSFASNEPYMIQSKVGKDSTLVLPYPTVEIDGEEILTPNNLSVTVKDPNHNSWVVTDADGSKNEGYTNPLTQKEIDSKDYFVFKPSKKVEGEETTVLYGTYSIVYKYLNSTTKEVATKSFKVNVSPNYSVENQKVTFTWDGTLPESAVLGNEVTLPTPITVDSNNNSASVDTYTKVTVLYHKQGEDDKEVEVDDFKFTPMDEAKSGSYYTIKYQIYTLEQLNLSAYSKLEDALRENADKALTKTYTLSNVTDTVAPVAKPVSAYDIKEDGSLDDEVIFEKEDEDASWSIPSKARTQVAISIPAIYATDNYSTYKDLTLSRTLIDENGNTYSLDGSSTLNGGDEDTAPKVVQSKVNEEATILFRLKGTYTVRYRATDKANNTKDFSYKIVVSDNLADDLAPSIVLPTLVESVKPGEEVSFSPATIVDYKTDSTSPEVIDTNVRKNVYYYYGKATDNTDFDQVDLTELKLDAETSKYSFEVEENPGESYVTVVFRAEDDGKYLGHQDGASELANNVAWSYKVIKISKVNDEIAPELENAVDLQALANSFIEAGENKYGQGETVTLGAVSYIDEDAYGDATEYLTSTLKVYDKNGNEIKVSGVQYTYDGSKFTIQNGKFVTTVAGKYQVVITTSDLGGNVIVNSVEFEVNDTKAPVIEVESLSSTMELGKTYTLPSPVVVDDGEVIENTAKTLVEFGEENPSYQFNQGTMEFTPLQKGTYTFRFVAKDGEDNETKSDWYSIIVADTIKPVISINENDEFVVPTTAQYKDANNNVIDVELPLFTATDEYNGIETTEITVKGPDGDDIAVTYVEETLEQGAHYKFTPIANGIYTVNYKAVDLAGNSSTSSYTIQVGDVTAPTVVVDSKNIPSSFNIGETLSIDLSKLSTVDDTDGTTEGKSAVDNNRLTIVLKDASGTEVSWTKENDIWSYEFTSAGSYTLTYKATDKAGNSDDVVYNFEVKGKSSSSSISEKTWGIVLIVVSVILLGGVVVYFVKTKDAPDAKEKKPNKEK